MAQLDFLPAFPYPANPLALFGLLLLAGVAGFLALIGCWRRQENAR